MDKLIQTFGIVCTGVGTIMAIIGSIVVFKIRKYENEENRKIKSSN